MTKFRSTQSPLIETLEHRQLLSAALDATLPRQLTIPPGDIVEDLGDLSGTHSLHRQVMTPGRNHYSIYQFSISAAERIALSTSTSPTYYGDVSLADDNGQLALPMEGHVQHLTGVISPGTYYVRVGETLHSASLLIRTAPTSRSPTLFSSVRVVASPISPTTGGATPDMPTDLGDFTGRRRLVLLDSGPADTFYKLTVLNTEKLIVRMSRASVAQAGITLTDSAGEQSWAESWKSPAKLQSDYVSPGVYHIGLFRSGVRGPTCRLIISSAPITEKRFDRAYWHVLPRPDLTTGDVSSEPAIPFSNINSADLESPQAGWNFSLPRVHSSSDRWIFAADGTGHRWYRESNGALIELMFQWSLAGEVLTLGFNSSQSQTYFLTNSGLSYNKQDMLDHRWFDVSDAAGNQIGSFDSLK